MVMSDLISPSRFMTSVYHISHRSCIWGLRGVQYRTIGLSNGPNGRMIERNGLAHKQHLASVLNVLDTIVARGPTFTRLASDLSRYHPPSGDHVFRVTTINISAAILLGLDPLLAGFHALIHDLGKREVWRAALNGRFPRSINRLFVCGPHMNATRSIAQRMPESEFAPYTRYALMEFMCHHDLFPNNGSPDDLYPRRRRIAPWKGYERRQPLPSDGITRATVLTFADKADRAIRGYNGHGGDPREQLYRMIDTHPIVGIHQQTLHRMAEVVAQETLALTPEILVQAQRILGT